MKHPNEVWAMYYNRGWMNGRDWRRGNPDRVGFYERACADARMTAFANKCAHWAAAFGSEAEIIDIVIAFSLGVRADDDSMPVASLLEDRFKGVRVGEQECIGYTPPMAATEKDYQSTAMARRVYLEYEWQRYEKDRQTRMWANAVGL